MKAAVVNKNKKGFLKVKIINATNELFSPQYYILKLGLLRSQEKENPSAYLS